MYNDSETTVVTVKVTAKYLANYLDESMPQLVNHSCDGYRRHLILPEGERLLCWSVLYSVEWTAIECLSTSDGHAAHVYVRVRAIMGGGGGGLSLTTLSNPPTPPPK